MIYFSTKFHMRSFNSSLVTVIKLKAKYISYVPVLPYCCFTLVPLKMSCLFSKALDTQNFRTLH